MICKHCAEGADVKDAPGATRHRLSANREKRNQLHGKCRGGSWCDCNHKGTKHERM